MDSLPSASTPEISLTPGDTNPSLRPQGEATDTAAEPEHVDTQLTTWLPPRKRVRRPPPLPRLSYVDLGYVTYGPSDSGGDHYALSGVYNTTGATIVDAAPPTWGSWFRQEGRGLRTTAHKLWEYLGTYQLEVLGILALLIGISMVALTMWFITQLIAIWHGLPPS
jgi:hypothetical protein